MRTRSVCLALLGLFFGIPPAAAADEDAAKPVDRARLEARALAQRGDRAFTIGRCDKAIPLWEAANERFYAPTILFRIARCQALMGNVVEATKTLEALVERPPEADEPVPFASARQQAAKELPNLRTRIAHIRVEVDASGLKVFPTLLVDGKPLSAGPRSIDVNPGEHQVRVEVRGQLWETSVAVEEGTTKTVRVQLGEMHKPPPARHQRTVGLIIGGVGVASLAAGAYFAASASSTSRQLDDICGPDRKECPRDRQDDIDRLRTHALLADFMLGGGAALFGAGAIVVLTEKPPKREEPRIEFFPVGLGGGVRGTF